MQIQDAAPLLRLEKKEQEGKGWMERNWLSCESHLMWAVAVSLNFSKEPVQILQAAVHMLLWSCLTSMLGSCCKIE